MLVFTFQVLILSIAVIDATSTEMNKAPGPTYTRTELKVSRSLNPEETQTLNVMTRDGSVAQLIVKKRDSKSRGSSGSYPNYYTSRYDPDVDYQKLSSSDQSYQTGRSSLQNLNSGETMEERPTQAVFTNWIPVSSVYYQPKLIRLDSIAVLRNATETAKPAGNSLGNVIDTDR